MTTKFGRTYRLTIDPGDGSDLIIITLPFTVNFTVQRNTMASLNNFVIDIYNLSENTRRRIFQDRFVARRRTVTFEAGYETLTTLFKGYIFEANSRREGPNVITMIEARDGSYDVTTKMTFQTIGAGQTVKDILKYLIGQYDDLELGAVGDFPEVLQRPVTLNGNTYELLKTYSNRNVFVDLGRVYVLKPNEVVPGELPVLSPATGLLESPRRDDAFLTVPTLFEPRVGMGQPIELASTISPIYNGQYKVLGVLHQGVISQAVNGPLRSTFNLFTGTQLFGDFTRVE